MDNIGGISNEDVNKFLVRLMLGSQYEKVVKATDEKTIIIGCLRSVWGDAFRHVSKNKWNNDSKKREIVKQQFKEPKGNVDELLDRYICENILSNDVVYDTFISYAKATSTEAKVEVIMDAIKNDDLRGKFKVIKEIDDKDQPLCFGQFQKLFNMAIKNYACVYMSRKELGLDDEKLFKLADTLPYADCPIDNIILKRIDEICEEDCKVTYGVKKFEDIKWSKFGAENSKFTTDHYKALQNTIKEILKIKYPDIKVSNLYFDFKIWN